MGFRQKMNQNPAAAGVIAVVLIIAAAAGIWYSMQPAVYDKPTKAYYTVDDGKSLFTDSIGKQTPFQYDGKEAVKAYVYTCDNGKSQFVAYLEKMPAGAKPIVQAEEARAAPAAAPKTEAEACAMASKRPANAVPFTALVRKPGDKEWLMPGSPAYFSVLSPRCPDASAKIDRVLP